MGGHPGTQAGGFSSAPLCCTALGPLTLFFFIFFFFLPPFLETLQILWFFCFDHPDAAESPRPGKAQVGAASAGKGEALRFRKADELPGHSSGKSPPSIFSSYLNFTTFLLKECANETT